MKVRNDTMRPPETSAHLEWVPGSRNSPSWRPDNASAPKICVSSPRITSGMPSFSVDRPGTSEITRPACSIRAGAATMSPAPAGQRA